jgi:hypothetical protein
VVGINRWSYRQVHVMVITSRFSPQADKFDNDHLAAVDLAANANQGRLCQRLLILLTRVATCPVSKAASPPDEHHRPHQINRFPDGPESCISSRFGPVGSTSAACHEHTFSLAAFIPSGVRPADQP